MSKPSSNALRTVGVLVVVFAFSSLGDAGRAQQRDSTLLRGPMSERPIIPVNEPQGGCKDPNGFDEYVKTEQVLTKCNWQSACSGAVNSICYPRYCQ